MFATPQPFRLVETGHDADGKAIIRFDGRTSRTVDIPGGTGVSELLWLDRPARSEVSLPKCTRICRVGRQALVAAYRGLRKQLPVFFKRR